MRSVKALSVALLAQAALGPSTGPQGSLPISLFGHQDVEAPYLSEGNLSSNLFASLFLRLFVR